MTRYDQARYGWKSAICRHRFGLEHMRNRKGCWRLLDGTKAEVDFVTNDREGKAGYFWGWTDKEFVGEVTYDPD